MSSLNLFSSLRAGACVLALVLASCGGGGGGGSDNTNPGGGNKNISLNVGSVSCNSFQNDFSADTHDVRVSWTNSKVQAFVVGSLPGEAIPSWLSADVIGSSSPITVKIHCTSGGVAPGHYAMTLRFVTGDASQQILGQKDIPVTFDIVADPVVNPVVTTWVETEAPADRTITVTPGAGVSVSNVSSTLPWLSTSLAGNTITLKATSESATLTPGGYFGTLQTTFRLGTRTKIIISPLEGTVTRALSGPPSLGFVINADTEAGDLTGRTATISTATVAQTAFTVQSDVPWLSVSGNTTGSSDNLGLTVVANQLPQLSFGVHTGTLLVTPANGATPLQIPINIDMRLPEVNFVAPVAFTDSLLTDYVIVRGSGFTSPGFALRIDGNVVNATQVVSDTEIRLIPGQRSVGDHLVSANGALGIVRDAAPLRVADPPAYHNALVPADVGPQDRVVSSPINGVAFSSRAYFTESYANPPVGNSSIISRFAYDAGTQQWTRTEHAYPQLFDFALSPDESLLIVLTESDLRIVDPGSMQTLDTYPLPHGFGGIARQLGVLNNGLVIIDAAHLVFSLRTRDFVDFPFVDSDGGMMVSLDGSRAVVGRSGAPYSYIDASTNTIVTAPTNHPFYCCGAISRHGSVVLINQYAMSVGGPMYGDLPTTGFVGDLSPSGHRAYGHDFQSGALRIFELPQIAELTPIQYPPQVSSQIGRIALDPAGRVAFKITDNYFVVTELP